MLVYLILTGAHESLGVLQENYPRLSSLRQREEILLTHSEHVVAVDDRHVMVFWHIN